MHQDNVSKPVNRFSIVDVTIDVLLLSTTFSLPVGVPDFLADAETGFLPDLLQLVLLFVGYFGFALYVARMYSATAVKKDNRWTHRVLFPTVPLLLFTSLIVINVLFSMYNIFQMIAPPVFTSLLLIVEALAFGFTFGLDFAIERHRSLDPKHAVAPDNTFSQSLSFVPYLLLTLLLLYPMDYFSLKDEVPIVGRIIILIGTCAVIHFLSNALNRSIFNKLRMSSRMNYATIAVVSFLLVVGFMGLDVLAAFARNHIEVTGASDVGAIVVLFFFGIVPLRVGTILFSRTSLFNRILGFIAVICYLSIESGLFPLSWRL